MTGVQNGFPNAKGASVAVDAFLCPGRDANMPASKERKIDSIFHVHSHDMEHLDEWLKEMLDLEYHHQGEGGRKRIKCKTPPGGERLAELYREKGIRYGIVFDELVRQVAVHSKDLARLVAKAYHGHHCMLDRLVRIYEGREKELQDLEVFMNGVVSSSERRLYEDEATQEDRAFRQTMLEAELRESKAQEEALRSKLFYFEDEVIRLRETVHAAVTGGHNHNIHNSLTYDSSNLISLILPQSLLSEIFMMLLPLSKDKMMTQGVTVLALSTEKVDMHAKHEREMVRILTQIGAEDKSQAERVQELSDLVNRTTFLSFLKGITRVGKRTHKRSVETQTRVTAPAAGPQHGEGGCTEKGKKRPPKKTKGKTELLPLELRTRMCVPSVPKKIPTLGYMLRMTFDVLVEASRSLEVVTPLCDRPGAMTELTIKHFQVL
ncbi:unnamed protein product [Choristocarpus tenellus]